MSGARGIAARYGGAGLVVGLALAWALGAGRSPQVRANPAPNQPGWELRVVPNQFRQATQPGHPWHDMTDGEQAQFTTSIFTNNIRVTLVAFAGGITAGIFTALALVYNGLLLGVIGGLMVKAGNGVGFVDLVTAHGVLELSCILVRDAERDPDHRTVAALHCALFKRRFPR